MKKTIGEHCQPTCIPFGLEGGHIISTKNSVFMCSRPLLDLLLWQKTYGTHTDKNINRVSILNFPELQKEVVEMAEWKLFEYFCGSKNLHLIPSLGTLPWLYHLDLGVLPLNDDTIAIANPLIIRQLTRLKKRDVESISSGLDFIKAILVKKGFKVVDLPIVLPLINNDIDISVDYAFAKYSSPILTACNALVSEKNVYYPVLNSYDYISRELMSEYSEYTESVISKSGKKAIPISISNAHGIHKGNLRCMVKVM